MYPPRHQPRHGSTSVQVTAGLIEAVDIGDITALTLDTPSGRCSLLLELAASELGRSLLSGVLHRWQATRTPISIVERDGQAVLSGGDARMGVTVLAKV